MTATTTAVTVDTTRSGVAPSLARMLWHQTRYDLLRSWRNRQSRFFSVFLPVVLLLQPRRRDRGGTSGRGSEASPVKAGAAVDPRRRSMPHSAGHGRRGHARPALGRSSWLQHGASRHSRARSGRHHRRRNGGVRLYRLWCDVFSARPRVSTDNCPGIRAASVLHLHDLPSTTSCPADAASHRRCLSGRTPLSRPVHGVQPPPDWARLRYQ